jgi:glc operon protein GlcG
MGLDHRIALAHIQKLVDIAESRNAAIACSVVDAGGRAVASVRMAGVGYVQLDAARRKANASAMFGAPTGIMSEMMGTDPKLAPVLADPEMLVLPGGLPLVIDGVVVGGIGVAGGHYSVDDAIVGALFAA